MHVPQNSLHDGHLGREANKDSRGTTAALAATGMIINNYLPNFLAPICTTASCCLASLALTQKLALIQKPSSECHWPMQIALCNCGHCLANEWPALALPCMKMVKTVHSETGAHMLWSCLHSTTTCLHHTSLAS